MQHFMKKSSFPVPVDQLFAWHERPGAFERLNPPWSPVRVVDRSGGISDGAQITIAVPPVGLRWSLKHSNYDLNRQFTDVQQRGPFKYWRHDHLFSSTSDTTSQLEDRIAFEPPCGLGGWYVKNKLESVFRYRHEVLYHDLIRHGPRRRVIVTGSSGMIGSALIPFLQSGGHEVLRAVRSIPRSDSEVYWNPESPSGERKAPWEGADVVVHLAGASIFGGRWNERRRSLIAESRVRATENLCRLLNSLAKPPSLLISMSGVNYYGVDCKGVLTETDPPGEGFLSEVVQGWEAATNPAELAGVRVVKLRLGVVLSPTGGALGLMLPIFRLGLGGVVGSGKQHMSWISLRDVLYMINHAIHNEAISGVVNGVSKAPCTNLEFTRTLAKVLNRPAVLPVPSMLVAAALGEVARETVLANIAVAPSQKLLDSGYAYADETLEQALSHCLGIA